MRRLLMRGAVSPLENYSIEEMLVYDKFGSNIGNLLYLYSVFRSLYTKDTEIDMDYYRGELGLFSEKDIYEINEKYDAYIIPLADAFRPDFIGKLDNLVRVITKLTIPCYILGIGIRAEYEPHLEQKFVFDDASTRFVKAVLPKTGIIGVRGEITGDYLKKLGFIEEKDYTVIGCPSMYTFGGDIRKRSLDLTKDSFKRSINYDDKTFPLKLIRYLNEQAKKYSEYQFVPQQTGELACLYLGMPYRTPDNAIYSVDDYPYDLSHAFFREDRVKGFVFPEAWFDNMHPVDLSIGGRLHGNIAAVLGEANALVIPVDARMRELAQFHQLPNIPVHLFDTKKDLIDNINNIDLSSHLKVAKRNFEHYLEFLNHNDLSTELAASPKRGNARLDSELKNRKRIAEIESIFNCSSLEYAQRVSAYTKCLKDKNTTDLNNKEKRIRDRTREVGLLKKEIEKKNGDLLNKERAIEKLSGELKGQIQENQKLNKVIQKKDIQLNRKSVKFALKIADSRPRMVPSSFLRKFNSAINRLVS